MWLLCRLKQSTVWFDACFHGWVVVQAAIKGAECAILVNESAYAFMYPALCLLARLYSTMAVCAGTISVRWESLLEGHFFLLGVHLVLLGWISAKKKLCVEVVEDPHMCSYTNNSAVVS